MEKKNYETHVKYVACDEVEVYQWWNLDVAEGFLVDCEKEDDIEWKEIREI